MEKIKILKNIKGMKLKFNRNLILVIVVSTMVIGGFGLGFVFGERSVGEQLYQPENLNLSLFWETYRQLKAKYVDPGKINEEKMIYGAISGMVDSLGDPYTVFMTPEETKKFEEDISGSFEGVGMEVGIKNKTLQVVAPIDGTPAQKAGLRPGDKILKVNDQTTFELTLDEAISLIRGPKNTKVTLTILRDGWEEPKDFEITRGVIEVPTLSWEMIDNHIAYVKLYNFSEKAGIAFTRMAVMALASDADKIILDLRNNPGGYLEIANEIAGFFLERGKIVTIEDRGTERIEHRARNNPVFSDFPVVVLINQGSASASEILAGALRDNLNIQLIGENSFGKGSVQQLQDLFGGSSLKITTAKWLTPKGETINEVGLKPDIEVKLAESDYESGKDPQLEKAIEVISNLK